MRRLLIVVALLIVVPAIELVVLISVGHVIGLWPTLLLVLATSVLGGWLLRREGGRSWRAFRDDLQAGRPPGNAATDGLLVLAGGVLMLVPGLVSDVFGLLLIFPPTRRLARAWALRVVIPRLGPTTVTSLFGARTVRARTGPASWEPPPPGPGTRASPGAAAPSPGATARPGPTETIEGEIIDPRPPSS